MSSLLSVVACPASTQNPLYTVAKKRNKRVLRSQRMRLKTSRAHKRRAEHNRATPQSKKFPCDGVPQSIFDAQRADPEDQNSTRSANTCAVCLSHFRRRAKSGGSCSCAEAITTEPESSVLQGTIGCGHQRRGLEPWMIWLTTWTTHVDIVELYEG